MSLSYDNEQPKRNRKDIYGDDITLDTSTHNSKSTTKTTSNSFVANTSYTQQLFHNLICDTYEKQRRVIRQQYIRSIAMFLVFFVLSMLGETNHIKDIDDVLRVFFLSLISVAMYKLLFYYPGRAKKARHKLDGYIDALYLFKDSPDSPLTYVDKTIELESKNEELHKEIRRLEDNIAKLELENLDFARKLLKNEITNSNLISRELTLEPIDDSEPIEW